MAGRSVEQMADRVAQLMAERLGIRGHGLSAKLRRGGRVLPRRIRREAGVLARAAEQARVPRLLARMDHARTAEAYDACLRYLVPLGRGARWRHYLLDLGAAVALVLVVTLAGVFAVMAWRGYL